MDINKQELGRLSEQLAASWLMQKGYRIIEKNFRCKLGELDLIAEHQGDLVFIEVRSRNTLNFGPPEETINLSKQRKLRKLAAFYLNKNKIEDRYCRFDVVGIVIEQRKVSYINHISNAF